MTFHYREQANEVWLVYPIVGGQSKVLVWKFLEDSASLDFFRLNPAE